MQNGGSRIVDLCAGGIFAAMFGDRSRVIWDALDRVSWPKYGGVFCSYSPHRQNYWRDAYIQALKDLTGFTSIALFSTGSEATEAFWRVCRVYNGRPGVWGGLVNPDEVGMDKPLCDAFHGMTLGAQIMAGRLTWPSLGIRSELGASRFGMAPAATSCMIMEPYHAPSAQFHRIDPTINRIMSLQKEFPDIPLCVDEIQGGFGRTGKLWAHEWYDGKLRPDFITIGKLCGGGFPVSALLGPAEIMESEEVREAGHLHSTHSGNPLACSVGLAVIDAMQEYDLIQRSASLGEKMHGALSTFPVRTHGKGLLAGLEMKDNEEVISVTEKCREAGVLVCDTGRRWVKIGPELTIDEKDLIEGISVLKEVIEGVVYARKIRSEACGDSGQGPDAGGENLPKDGISGDRSGDDQGGEATGWPGEHV